MSVQIHGIWTLRTLRHETRRKLWAAPHAVSRPAVTGRSPTLHHNAFVNKLPAHLGTDACYDDRIHATADDRLQLPLQEGTLTPTDAALFARLASAALLVKLSQRD